MEKLTPEEITHLERIARYADRHGQEVAEVVQQGSTRMVRLVPKNVDTVKQLGYNTSGEQK